MAAAEPVRLEPGITVDRQLVGGEVHQFRLELPAEHYLHAVIDQQGIDVVVSIFDPAGGILTDIDSPNGKQGPEKLYLVTATAGSHRLEVRSGDSDAATGRYQATIVDLRPATQHDRHRVAAEHAYALGVTERWAKTSGSFERAIGYFEEAARRWRLVGDRIAEADTLNRMGLTCRAAGDSPAAIGHYRQALELVRQAGDRVREASVLHNLGVAHQASHELDKALSFFQQALPLRRAADDPQPEATTLISLGQVYKNLGEYQQALELNLRALKILQAAGARRNLATVLNNLGTVYESLGRFEQALSYFGQALELNRASGHRRLEAGTLNNIGWAQHFSGEPAKALESFEQALELVGRGRDRGTRAKILTHLGRSLVELGQTGRALPHLEQSLELRRALGDRPGEATTMAEMAIAYTRQGNVTQALDLARRAHALSLEVKDRHIEAFSLRAMAGAARRRGDFDLGRRDIEAAVDILETLRRGSPGHENRVSFQAFKRPYYEDWIDLLMELHSRQPAGTWDAQALGASERARARGLVEMLARVGVGEHVDSEVARTHDRRINALELRRMRLASQEPPPPELAAVGRELETALAEYQTLRSRMRAANPRLAALTEPKIPDLRQIREDILDHQTVLLHYSLGRHRSFLWLVTPEQLNSFVLPGREQLETAARRVYQLLTARERWPGGEDLATRRIRIRHADLAFNQAAGELSGMLLGPAAGLVGGKRLVIVAEGALEYVPFAALPEPASSDIAGGVRPLVLKHEIVRLPSVSVVSALRRQVTERPPAVATLAVLADPVFESDDPRLAGRGPDADTPTGEPVTRFGAVPQTELGGPVVRRFQRLRYSRREAESIAALLSDQESTLALDFAASRALVTGGGLDRYRIVHFATHGLINSRHPELSALVLSTLDPQGRPVDGFLRLRDIYRLELRADLVVLSACQTALGRQIRGEGLIGLTRGFMYAGAGRVLASLWTVQDRATQELMTRFYRRLLRDGEPPAAALRAAQISLRQEKRFEAPYYWAAFVMQGDWR